MRSRGSFSDSFFFMSCCFEQFISPLSVLDLLRIDVWRNLAPGLPKTHLKHMEFAS